MSTLLRHFEAHSATLLWGSMVWQLSQPGVPYVGVRQGGAASELFGVTLRLEDPKHNIVTNKVRAFSQPYAGAEVLWYLRGNDNIDLLLPFAPSYSRFAEDNRAFGAYGPRLMNHLFDVVDAILATPAPYNNRRLVIPLYRPQDAIEAACNPKQADIPCTLSLQFLLSNGELRVMATMRSNDVWLGLPYDMFAFTTIGQLVSDMTGVPFVEYLHCVGSMHLYDKDKEKLSKCNVLEELPFPQPKERKVRGKHELITKDQLRADVRRASTGILEFAAKYQANELDQASDLKRYTEAEAILFGIQTPLIRDLASMCLFKYISGRFA